MPRNNQFMTEFYVANKPDENDESLRSMSKSDFMSVKIGDMTKINFHYPERQRTKKQHRTEMKNVVYGCSGEKMSAPLVFNTHEVIVWGVRVSFGCDSLAITIIEHYDWWCQRHRANDGEEKSTNSVRFTKLISKLLVCVFIKLWNEHI